MRHIGKADVEFYHAGMVLTAAKALAQKPWDSLSYRSRQRYLDRAASVCEAILNDYNSIDSIRIRINGTVKEQI